MGPDGFIQASIQYDSNQNNKSKGCNAGTKEQAEQRNGGSDVNAVIRGRGGDAVLTGSGRVAAVAVETTLSST